MYLAHHGVKGQRWGVRHDNVNSTSSKSDTEQKINAYLNKIYRRSLERKYRKAKSNLVFGDISKKLKRTGKDIVKDASKQYAKDTLKKEGAIKTGNAFVDGALGALLKNMAGDDE